MSQISAREDSESPLARQHWLSETIPVEAWGEVLAGVHGMSDSLVTHLKAVAGSILVSNGPALRDLRRSAAPVGNLLARYATSPTMRMILY